MREILLIKSGGMSYAVAKDQVFSTREAGAVHFIPMTPRLFAGVGLGGEGLSRLFDLSGSLGLETYERRISGSMLVMEEGRIPAGFICQGTPDTLSVEDGDIMPLPEFLSSQVMDSCVLVDGALLPLINVKWLFVQVMAEKWDCTEIELTVQSPGGELDGPLRFLRLGGEVFAVPEGDLLRESVSPGSIDPLPLAPAFVRGVFLHEGSVRAAIDPAQRMGLRRARHLDAAETDEVVLLTDIGAGFLVDSVMGLREGLDTVPLPPLAASSLMRYGVLVERDVVPLLVARAFAEPETAVPLDELYGPASKDSLPLLSEEFGVTEFSLLDDRFGVPRLQVDDVTGMSSIRRLPGVHSIMVGVVEHRGDILPVLDLELVFGRVSGIHEGTRMVRIENGEFRAMLLAEDVDEGLGIKVEDQHEFPMRLNHNYVYACYMRDTKVRLVLNVRDLTLYFDESLVRQVFASYAPDITEDVREDAAAMAAVAAGEVLAEQEAEEARLATLAAEEETKAKAEEEARLIAEQEAEEARLAALAAEEEAKAKAEEEARLKAEEDAAEARLVAFAAEEARLAALAAEDEAKAGAKEGASGRGKRVALLVLLILLLAFGGAYLTGVFEPVPERQVAKHVKDTQEAPKAEPEKAEPVVVKPEPVVVEPTPVESEPVVVEPVPVKDDAVLVLRAPSGVKATTYVVRRGDTLWHISKRYTGDPFNYPLIADNNRIPNPDLIYPGQRVRIVPNPDYKLRK